MMRGICRQQADCIGQFVSCLWLHLMRPQLTDMSSGSGLTDGSPVQQRLPTTIIAKRVTVLCDSEGEAVSVANGSRGPARMGLDCTVSMFGGT
jgi:hypothetical protein